MGRFSAIFNADIKVLFRQYRPEFIVPAICVFVGGALYFLEDIPPTLVAVFLAWPLISLYERMFSRTENEAINYQLVPSIGRPLVAAKNAGALIMFLGLTVPAIVIPCVVLRCEAVFTIRAVLQVVVIGLFLLPAGNIASARVLEKNITSLSFLNGVILGISITMAVVLYVSLSAILGQWAGSAVCALIPCVMYAFSLKETAGSVEDATWGLLEVT